MKKSQFLLLLLYLGLSFQFDIVIEPSNLTAQTGSGQNFHPPPVTSMGLNQDDIVTGRYIVKFKDPPLSVYRGGVPNFPPTNPSARGEKKLDSSSPDSINYLNHLDRKHADIHQTMEKALERGIDIERTFRVAFNGAIVEMSAAEARRIAKLPEIASVIPDKMRHLHTDNGPRWIGADDIWNGTDFTATKGEGIVIGVIDTGINPANASFADTGGDGHIHDNPRARKNTGSVIQVTRITMRLSRVMTSSSAPMILPETVAKPPFYMIMMVTVPTRPAQPPVML